jgi:hypothetical protein
LAPQWALSGIQHVRFPNVLICLTPQFPSVRNVTMPDKPDPLFRKSGLQYPSGDMDHLSLKVHHSSPQLITSKSWSCSCSWARFCAACSTPFLNVSALVGHTYRLTALHWCWLKASAKFRRASLPGATEGCVEGADTSTSEVGTTSDVGTTSADGRASDSPHAANKNKTAETDSRTCRIVCTSCVVLPERDSG